MGQRHQIFIKTLNPLKLKRSYLNDEEKKEAKKIFGSGKYTVLAFHHQWLYGYSAAVNISNVMTITNPDLIAEFQNPFDESYMVNSLEEYINTIKTMVQMQFNPIHPRGIGIERIHFLNKDEPEMRHYFDAGDNNDGISIIDTIERKYCLMNISSYSPEDADGIYSLKQFEPVNADAYVNAYYPKSKVKNKRYTKALSKFAILTTSEVKKIFPKMKF